MTEPTTPPQSSDERQTELDRDQAIFDLGQAVADRDQQSSDHEQDRTDHDRAMIDLSAGGTAADALNRPAIKAAQQRRDAHQQVLDDTQDARDREQLTLDAQQDLLTDTSIPEALDTAMRRFESAENRAVASHQRAEAALRRARHARTRAATIAQLDAAPHNDTTAETTATAILGGP